MNILVGIPSYNGDVHPLTRKCLNSFTANENPWIDVRIIPRISTALGRNVAIMGTGVYTKNWVPPFDYFLSMDADMGLTVEQIEKLIAEDKEIISAWYYAKKIDPRIPETADLVLCASIKPYECMEDIFLTREYIDNKVLSFPVSWVGAGATLIKASVFKKLPFPWYRNTVLSFKNKKVMVGEDIGFCMLATKHGIKTYLNPMVHAEHYSVTR